MRRLFVLFFPVLVLSSCHMTEETPGDKDDKPEVKSLTVTADPSKGMWSAGDMISVIDEKGNHKYTAGTEGASSPFKGGYGVRYQGGLVVFPYDPSLIPGDTVSVTVPSECSGTTVLSAAFSEGETAILQPLLSSISFSVAGGDIARIEISGVSGEPLAGQASIIVDRETSEVSVEPSSGAGILTVIPVSGKVFGNPDTVHVSCIPGNFPSGFSVTCIKTNGTSFTFPPTVPRLLKPAHEASLGNFDLAPLDPSSNFMEVLNDTIPDFSRVGYHYGDRPVPDVPVVMTLEAPSDGSDALPMIQNAIRSLDSPGAILLKAGTYNISSTIKLDRPGVVLRGEGENTVLYCTTAAQISEAVIMGISSNRRMGASSRIIAKYVPCGQMWVPVEDPSMFSVGETVYIYRPATGAWLDAIHMREIAQNASSSVKQWKESEYSMYWERVVTGVDGYKIYLDNPVAMGIGGNGWGEGALYKGEYSRISECGIENLTIDCIYDASKVESGRLVDEDHCWSGIKVMGAENSWVRNVTTRHMGLSCVQLVEGAYKVTVSGCRSLSPVSLVTGSRRYAFNFNGCQLCLIEGCHCESDRHQYVCGARVPGPNVFLRCTSSQTLAEAGPHQRWSTAVLYDNVHVAGSLNLHDRGASGSGHGWTCANTVLWNCEARSIVCQSPWASAYNWAVGCIGVHTVSVPSVPDRFGARPEGRWISEGVHVTPGSLYDSQLEERHASGIWLDP